MPSRFFTVSMLQEFLMVADQVHSDHEGICCSPPVCVHLQCDSVSMNGAYMTKSAPLFVVMLSVEQENTAHFTHQSVLFDIHLMRY